MTDDLPPRERALLDLWEPMTPPAGFADRVLSVGPRRWLPYAVTALACGGAAAIIALVLSRPTAVAPVDASQVAVTEIDAALPIITADAAPESDCRMPPMPTEAPYDLSVDAGESFTIHDPTGATTVQFRSDHCADGVSVELDRGGTSDGVVSIATGTWSYHASCRGGSALASGKIVALRDPGTRPLPASPGSTPIDADGRTWRVVYQSVIPELVIHQPALYGRPTATGYQLHLIAGGTHQLFDAPWWIARVPGARLQEGTYQFWFDRDGVMGDQVSTLKIEFDQTAPQVYLDEPAQRSPTMPMVTVRGAAVPGWTASIDGIDVPIDASRRFSATARPSRDLGVVVRFAHPKRGIHYFVRRLRAS